MGVIPQENLIRKELQKSCKILWKKILELPDELTVTAPETLVVITPKATSIVAIKEFFEVFVEDLLN